MTRLDDWPEYPEEPETWSGWSGYTPDPLDDDPLLDREPMGGDPYWAEDLWD